MNRRDTKELTTKLRQSIIDLLIEQPKTIREINQHIDASYHNLNYHVDRLVELGYLAMSGNIKKSGATSFVYKALKTKYIHVVKVRKVQKVEEKAPMLGTLIELTNKVMWTPAPRKSGRVHIGSTLSDAYMGV